MLKNIRSYSFLAHLFLLLLFAIIVIAFMTIPSKGEAAEKGECSVVVACSDFQDPACKSGNASSYGNGMETVKSLLSQVSSNYINIDGLICCGDYCYDTTRGWNAESNTNVGINAFKNAVHSVYPEANNLHLIQGNHDYKTSLLANFGANDTEDYGVFVINEENFPSKQASLNAKNIVLNTANALDSYLAKKTSEEYIKPIFIVSHVPLHFSTRTQEDSDNIYAKYIFDVCNKYGEDLNLIFLYGHNHAHGDDNYMGGASQFLKYDDSIYIAQLGSNTQYTDEKIDFIYMNAGYIGYYWDNWQTHYTPTNVDADLTMTSFEISEDQVIIKRWDKSGEHYSLKSAGANTIANTTDRKVKDIMPVKDNVYDNIYSHARFPWQKSLFKDSEYVMNLNE